VPQRDARRRVERSTHGCNLTQQVEDVCIVCDHVENMIDVPARRLETVDDIDFALAREGLAVDFESLTPAIRIDRHL
jgi:hypothetical protein